MIVHLPSRVRVGEVISPALSVAATRTETIVSFLTDIGPADLVNPLLSLEAALEVSFDGGVSWEHELGFTWRGGPRSPLIPATLSPSMRLSRARSDGVRLPLRFRGALVRIRLVVPTAMAVGASVDVT